MTFLMAVTSEVKCPHCQAPVAFRHIESLNSPAKLVECYVHLYSWGNVDGTITADFRPEPNPVLVELANKNAGDE